MPSEDGNACQSLTRNMACRRALISSPVWCVVNFGLPATSRAYAHRVARTSHAGHPEIAIVGGQVNTKNDENVFGRITQKQRETG